jgi:hypothetical protein
MRQISIFDVTGILPFLLAILPVFHGIFMSVLIIGRIFVKLDMNIITTDVTSPL